MAAAGKPPAVSPSLVLEAKGLDVEADVEADLACMATLFWAEAVWTSRWKEDPEDAWRKQVWEVKGGRQVKGPAGADNFETRDQDTL